VPVISFSLSDGGALAQAANTMRAEAEVEESDPVDASIAPVIFCCRNLWL